MKIIYGKELEVNRESLLLDISTACDITLDTARLLLYRNIDTVEKAKAFLSPGKSRFNDPFLLSGMAEAVELIADAKNNNRSVLVFGDYDADGICATTVLYNCLREFGIDARFFVPEREDNYGLNVNTVSALNQEKKIDLLITVDCGISDCEKIDELSKMGIDVIVTDHHEPPEVLPKCICINPKVKGQAYPFDGLCGAGVAYKLGYALIGKNADSYLDFVALATVADSMDLVFENRDIVVEGLKLFNNPSTLRLPFKYLLGDNNRQVTAQTFMYTVAPRVNAGGRMGDAKCALKLFTETDPNKIFDLAVKLNNYNIERQTECDNIYREAKKIIDSNSSSQRNIILVGNESWKVGFVGIVAARLVEDYARPVIVFAGHEGYLKGSARSVEELNIFEALTEAKDLLVTFGGHSQAAGVTVTKENFNTLFDKLDDYVGKLDLSDAGEKTVVCDIKFDSEMSIRFAKEIESLEPFGVGNRRPLFAVDVNAINSIPLKLGSPHYSYRTVAAEMLDFNGEKNVKKLALPIKKTILFEANLSSYKNRESLKGYVRFVCPDYSDLKALEPFAFMNELQKLKEESTEKPNEISRDGLTDYLKKGVTVVINDLNDLEDIEELKNLEISALCEVEGGKAQVIYSPSETAKCKTAIYIGTPIADNYIGEENFLFNLNKQNSFVKRVSVDRSEFIGTFSALKSLCGKSFKDSASFALKYFSGDEVYQAIFAVEVFIELGIFKINQGVLTLDEKIKNALTNSKVYSKIYTIKESYVRDI